MIEDNRCQNNENTNDISYFRQQNKSKSNNHHKNNSLNNSRGHGNFQGFPRGLAPTRNNQSQKVSSSENMSNFSIQQMQQMIDDSVQRLNNSNKNQSDTNHVNVKNEDVENSGFMMNEEINIAICKNSRNDLVYDSGATKSTLCNYKLLIDPTAINKSMNNYGKSIQITHIGKLNLNGVILYPVY